MTTLGWILAGGYVMVGLGFVSDYFDRTQSSLDGPVLGLAKALALLFCWPSFVVAGLLRRWG